MPTDEELMLVWDAIEEVTRKSPVSLEETEHGYDFKNAQGEIVFNIPIAGEY